MNQIRIVMSTTSKIGCYVSIVRIAIFMLLVCCQFLNLCFVVFVSHGPVPFLYLFSYSF